MSDRFEMDNGAGYHTQLWRVLDVIYVGRDAPPGEPYTIEIGDEDGHPVDDFGLPIDGKFITSPQN